MRCDCDGAPVPTFRRWWQLTLFRKRLTVMAENNDGEPFTNIDYLSRDELRDLLQVRPLQFL